MYVSGFISFIVRPLFVEWQRFALSSLGLLMLKHLDENERRWQSIADEAASHCKTEQACDSYGRASSASSSTEVKKVCSTTETVIVHQKPDSTCDTESSQKVSCSAESDCDEPDGCVTPSAHLEPRRGSLPSCDNVPLIPAGPRRNSAPVIGQCAALAVKKYLLATLAEHSSSFCMRNSSSESDQFLPSSNQYHSKKSAVTPLNVGTTHISIEGRPRDRRSNSHALVFCHCFLARRIAGRRFSSPAVGQEHWMMSRNSESVPLLSPVMPSSSVCSHPALVNWFVAWFFIVQEKCAFGTF